MDPQGDGSSQLTKTNDLHLTTCLFQSFPKQIRNVKEGSIKLFPSMLQEMQKLKKQHMFLGKLA